MYVVVLHTVQQTYIHIRPEWQHVHSDTNYDKRHAPHQGKARQTILEKQIKHDQVVCHSASRLFYIPYISGPIVNAIVTDDIPTYMHAIQVVARLECG